jgi:Mn-containing catalase
MGHIEILATAVALNLENAPASLQESAIQSSSLVSAVVGGGERPRHMVEGMLQKHLLSTGTAAFPAIPTACRSTARTSMPAAISPLICSPA